MRTEEIETITMAYARFYESSTSGLNFDRFVDRFDESTITKMKQQYWTAKQLIRTKLGKKEDDHLLASDAEFDAKIALFKFVRDTSEQMLCCIDDYQHFLGELIQSEFELSKMLKDGADREGTAAGRVMAAVSRVLALAAHHRLQIRAPLLRFFSELHVFAERAIVDCGDTVEAAEKHRIEYRGSLLWMKKISAQLDPDTENAMEKFRTAQNVVRRNKERLDGLKLDTLQKGDLLAASRCNLFSQLLERYQKLLYTFYEQTALAYEKIYGFVSECKHYDFEVLKDLMEPTRNEDGSAQYEAGAGKEENQEVLIDLGEKEQEMKSVLQELEDLNAHGPLSEHSESPLGQVDERTSDEKARYSQPAIGPLPALQLDDAEVPAIAPPPGWKPVRRENKYSSDLNELLDLDDSLPTNESFAADWSKLMAAPNPVGTITTQSTTEEPSTLPSRLFDLSATSNSFPNPFTDPGFDAWKGFLKDFETVDSGAKAANDC